MKCEACDDKGWLHAFDTELMKYEIQRCDSCGIIVDDESAGEIHATNCKCEWEMEMNVDITKFGPLVKFCKPISKFHDEHALRLAVTGFFVLSIIAIGIAFIRSLSE